MARVWLATTLVASACTFGFGAGPAEAAQSGSVSLKSMSLTVATSPSQTLQLVGSLTLPPNVSYSGVIVQLDIMPVQYRSQMNDGAGSDIDEQQLSSVQDNLGNVSGSVPWTLKTTVGQMGLVPGNVYALDVEAWSEGSQPLGAVRTYLPYQITGGSFTPTQLAVLVPLTAASSMDGYQYQPKDNGSPWDEVTSNQLISSMGQTGSLDQLLEQSQSLKGVDLSWAVDPDLLDTAAAIQSGYFIAGNAASEDQPGSGADNVASWLKLAKTVLAKNGELWQLPSTDPDLGSLSHVPNTLAQQFLAASTKLTAASTTLADATGRQPSGLLAWPAQGQVDSTTLDLAQSLNPRAVITASNSVNLKVAGGRYTPTGRASIGGKDDIAVSDSDLDAIMAGDPVDASYTAAGSAPGLLAQQRLLAQTALIAREQPSLTSPRTILVTLPRAAEQSAPDMAVLSALTQASWIKPTTLSALLAATPDAGAHTGKPTRSAAVQKTDLTTAQLTHTLGLSNQRSLYQSILMADDTSDGLAQAVERTVSTSWRGSSSDWSAFAAAVQRRLTMQMAQVYLIQKSDLTMSGTSGSIPFTVHNGLDQRVVLGLDFSMRPPGRLDIAAVPVVEVPAHSSRTIQVQVTSRSPSASIEVTAYLVNSIGQHYGDAENNGSQTLQVSVTSIGFVALLLFAGSAALLVIAVGLRIYRGRRGSRKQPETREGD